MSTMMDRRVLLAAAGAGMGGLAAGVLATPGQAHAAEADPGFPPFTIPQQFGAAGDGVTDDTKAVQAAIDATAGQGDQRLVVLPPGRYKLTSPVQVGENLGRLKLMGYGTMATHTSQLTNAFDGPAVEWHGTLGHIDGVAIVSAKKTANTVGVKVGKTVNTDDMDFSVTSCNFTSQQIGVQQSGRGLYFMQNLVALCGTCIDISWPHSGVEGVGPHLLPYGLRKWLITANHFHTPTDFAIKFHGEPDGDFRGAIISNNLMDIGRRLFWGSLTNSVITGNIVENNSRTDGPDGTGPAPVVYVAAGGHGVSITGNQFGGFEAPPSGTYAEWQGVWPMGDRAIVFGRDAHVHHTTISSNSIAWTNASPIVVEGDIADSTITANTFEGWDQSSAQGEAALRIDGDAERLTVTGNAFGTAPIDLPPVLVAGTLQDSSLTGNTHAASKLLKAGSIKHSKVDDVH